MSWRPDRERGLGGARTHAGSREPGAGRREWSREPRGPQLQKGEENGRSWGAGGRGRRGLEGRRGQVGFPSRLAISKAPAFELAAAALPRALRRSGRDHGEVRGAALSRARWPGPSGRPRVAGRRGELAGPEEVSGVGAGPGVFSVALASSADVDTLARARAGGGRLGPRRGRCAARRSEAGLRGVCAGGGRCYVRGMLSPAAAGRLGTLQAGMLAT